MKPLQHSPLVETTSAPESQMLVARMAPAAIGSRRERRRIASAAAGIRSLGIGAVVFTLRGSSAPGTGTVKVSTRTGDTASWRANSVPRRQLCPDTWTTAPASSRQTSRAQPNGHCTHVSCLVAAPLIVPPASREPRRRRAGLPRAPSNAPSQRERRPLTSWKPPPSSLRPEESLPR